MRELIRTFVQFPVGQPLVFKHHGDFVRGFLHLRFK